MVTLIIMRFLSILALVPLLAATAAGASDPAMGGGIPLAAGKTVTRIAMLDFKVEGTDPGIGAQLTARFSELIGKRPGVSVIAPDDVRAMLQSEASKQLVGCTDDSCLAEIAGALDADLLISGQVARIVAAYALTVSAVDARQARALGRVTETWQGESIALLELAIPVVDRLFDGDKLTGSIEVTGAVEGSRILLGDQVRGTAPAGQMAGIPIGAHLITLTVEGYQPFTTAVVVKRDQLCTVPAQQLVIEDPPVYATWWFWTLGAAGALGIGGAAAGVAYLMLGPDSSPSGVNVAVNADSAATGGR